MEPNTALNSVLFHSPYDEHPLEASLMLTWATDARRKPRGFRFALDFRHLSFHTNPLHTHHHPEVFDGVDGDRGRNVWLLVRSRVAERH